MKIEARFYSDFLFRFNPQAARIENTEGAEEVRYRIKSMLAKKPERIGDSRKAHVFMELSAKVLGLAPALPADISIEITDDCTGTIHCAMQDLFISDMTPQETRTLLLDICKQADKILIQPVQDCLMVDLLFDLFVSNEKGESNENL